MTFKIKWISVFLAINLLLFGVAGALYKVLDSNSTALVYEQLNAILDNRLAGLADTEIPSDPNAFVINSIMAPVEHALGESGETYLIRKGINRECHMASRSRFEGYNDTKIMSCTDHWQAVLDSGTRSKGTWSDYRGIKVYGVGQRIARHTLTGFTLFAVVAERDVAEVRKGIIEISKIAIASLIAMALLTLIGCVIGYRSQLKQRKLAIENKLTLESVPSGIIRIDEQGIIQAVNPAMRKLFGYEDGEMIGQSVSIIIPDDYKQRHDDGFAKILSGGEPSILGKQSRASIHGKRKDGSIFPCTLTPDQVLLPEGRQFSAVVVDMTVEVEARQKIQKQVEQQKMVGYVYRHDLANLVGPSATAIEYMMEAGHDQDALEMAHHGLQGALQMFEDLGNWSRCIEAGSDADLEKKQVQLRSIIDAVLIEGADITVAENLPEIECNEGLMIAAIRNILENSVRYAPDVPDINIYMEGSALIIKDHSGGFGCVDGKYDEEYAQRLTQVGQRGSHGLEGSGLGMANTIAALDANRFEFSWKTECGVGTRWKIELQNN